MADYILVLDEGTTSTRAMLFASDGVLVASAQKEITQHYPQAGWAGSAGQNGAASRSLFFRDQDALDARQCSQGESG